MPENSTFKRGIFKQELCRHGGTLFAGDNRQTCQNLIQNALKYAVDKADVNLTKINGECVLSFSNNTADIKETDVPRLFDRFYTADKSRSGGSTGVGLYLVKVLVEKMGGRVDVELRGDVFTIRVTFAYNR